MAHKNQYIHVGDNDAPEIQCIVCKQEDCDYYIELNFATILFIGMHKSCFKGYKTPDVKTKRKR